MRCRLTPFARRWLLPLLLLALMPLAQAMTLGVSVNPDPVRPGQVMMVSVTVANDSGAAVNNVQVQAQMPASGVNSLSDGYGSAGASCPGGGCDPTEFVTWNLGLMGPGQGATVSIPMVVSSSAAAGTTITVPARLLLGGVQTLAVSQSVTVSSTSALTLAVDADRNGVAPGDRIVYDLTYGNRSASGVTGTTLSFPLPAGATLVSASGGGTASANGVTWNLGTLQAGQSGRQQVVVIVSGALPSGTLLPVQAAALAASSPITGAEFARAAIVSRTQTNQPLALAVAMNGDPVRPGELVASTFTVTNQSDATIFGALLTARMPKEGLDSLSSSYGFGGLNCPGGGCDPSELMTWNIGTLAPRASVTFSLPSVVSSSYGSGRLISMEAEVHADGIPMALSGHTVAVDPDNALSLALDADRNAIAPGDALTYTLTYGNRSPSSVTGTALTLPLPAGVVFVSATGGVLVGNSVSWNLATLQAGQSGRQQVVVATGTLGSGTLLNVDAAQIVGTSPITGPEAARATLATRVQAEPALGLAVAMNADPVRPGEVLTSTLTVTNRSNATVFGARLTARMPMEGIDSISDGFLSGGANCPGGGCDASELLTWNVGTMAPHSSRTFSLPARVASAGESGRLISLEAWFQADGLPSIAARHTLAIDADNALSLAVDAGKDNATPGSQLIYVLTYGNRSNATINGTTLAFPLPEGASLVASSGGSLSGRTVSWDLGSLLAGAGGQRTVTVAVPSPAPASERLVVDAALLSGTSNLTGVEAARAGAVTRIMSGNPLALTILGFTPNPVLPTGALTASFRVTNVGAVPLLSVVVTARVPSMGVESFSQTLLGTGGSCPGGGCDPAEFASWGVGTLQPGASATVTLPLKVGSGLSFGRLIALEAFASDAALDLALVSATSVVGNAFSPAPPSQSIGDFDGNGVVNFADLALLKAHFGSTDPRYDLNGDGVVNFADLAIFKGLFGL